MRTGDCGVPVQKGWVVLVVTPAGAVSHELAIQHQVGLVAGEQLLQQRPSVQKRIVGDLDGVDIEDDQPFRGKRIQDGVDLDGLGIRDSSAEILPRGSTASQQPTAGHDHQPTKHIPCHSL
jgi:hypothetical protein